MLHSPSDFLAHHALVTLFLTIGAGFVLARVRIAGVGLGVASVMFSGLALGAWGGAALELPPLVGQLGLALFVYMVGLESGPGFFRLLGRRGAAYAAVAALATGLLVAGALFALQGGHLSPALVVGLFCGAGTNTPALAAVTAALQGTPLENYPTLGYALCYPLGVLIPLLLAELAFRRRRVDLAEATRRAEAEAGLAHEAVAACNLVVQTPDRAVVPLAETALAELPVHVTRVQHGDETRIPGSDALLAHGDVLHVVGEAEAVEQALATAGFAPASGPGPEERRDMVDFRRIILSNTAYVGRPLTDLRLDERFGARVTRVRRGDVDFLPGPETRLALGDRLRVVAPREQLAAVSNELGDSFRAYYEVDFLALPLGLVLGLLLGAWRCPLPNGGYLELGVAGGPLLVALVLGALGRTGPLIWALPLSVNQVLRQFGLVLFFATVGLRAGHQFVGALSAQGLVVLAIGGLTTLAVTGTVLFLALRLLKLDWLTSVALLGGAQTQPAVLVFATEKARSEAPEVSYAAILPFAMLMKIVAAQILLACLLPSP